MLVNRLKCRQNDYAIDRLIQTVQKTVEGVQFHCAREFPVQMMRPVHCRQNVIAQPVEQ